MIRRSDFRMAPDTGGASGTAAKAPVATPADAGYIDETLPQPGRSRDIDPYDDTEFVIAGSEAAAALEAEPPEIAGKSRAEIAAELERVRAEVAAEKARADPVAALQQTLSQVLQPSKAAQPLEPGYMRYPQVPQAAPTESPEARKARRQELWLSDPDAAARETALEQQQQLALLVANNQAQLSRELVMANPETKKVYDRYAEEVESEVARMPPMERIQNPRVYQTAMDRVRYRHQDEFISEALTAKVDELVKAKLAALGVAVDDAAAPVAPGPKAPVYSRATVPGRPPAQPRTTIVIPPAVAAEAERLGVDPKFYYQHLKTQGRI